MAFAGTRWWTWWGRLIDDFGDKLAAEGLMTASDVLHLRSDWAEASHHPQSFIHTPVILQVVARRD
jgi:hypothetical protein